MAEFENDTVEIKGLDQLVKALKVKPPIVRIGVLGSSSRPASKGNKQAASNAEVGAAHEFGAPARGIPQRSFLRVPISEHLEKELEKSGITDPDTLGEVIKSGDLIPWMQKIAVVAEGIVDDAFETSGDGKWPAWKDPNYTNEGGMLLVNTGALRDSITSEVIE